MRKTHYFSFAIAILITLSACKYEKGPFIAFTPKGDRVNNTWIEGEVFINDVAATTAGIQKVTFFDGGNVSIDFDNGAGGTIAYVGDWAFSDKKKDLVLTLVEYQGTAQLSATWPIIKLKEKQLWVRYTAAGQTVEIHFVPK